MSVRDFGKSGGFLTVGEVINRKDDPTQSGLVRVRWLTGGAVQHEIGDEDLPWTASVHSGSNPSKGQTGGPHTGYQEGTRVVGIPIDGQGQDFLILGSLVAAGKGNLDEPGQIDSDIPQAAKSQENGGEKQPRWGDVNGVVTKKSIVEYAQSEAGGRSAKYATMDDPIGTLDKEIV